MAGVKAKTNLTFQVTLSNVEGASIPTIREYIKNSLKQELKHLDIDDPLKFDADTIKVHLTNKEVNYAKR